MNYKTLAFLILIVAPVAHAAPDCLQREIAALEQRNAALTLDLIHTHYAFNGDQFDPNNLPFLRRISDDQAAQSANDLKIKELNSGKLAPECDKNGTPVDLPDCAALANASAWMVAHAVYADNITKPLDRLIAAASHSEYFKGTTVGQWRGYIQSTYILPLEAHLLNPPPSIQSEVLAEEAEIGGVSQALSDSTPLSQALSGFCRDSR